MKNLKTIPGIICNCPKGFGFMETLVVMAVIGVLSSIAIPALAGILGRADVAKVRRNAQILVSTFNAARAAGNETGYPDPTAAISAITTFPGINGSGPFATNRFYVSMAPPEITEAVAKISPDFVGSPTEGTLIVTP